MDKCPVCNSPLNPQDESCAACGYRLQDTTEEFKVVSLEPDTTDVPPLQHPLLRFCMGNRRG